MIDIKADAMISLCALLKKLKKEHESIRQIYYSLIDYVDKAICKGELGTYARVKRIVEEAPAVDAVEVVRCKDCIHYEMGVCLKIYSDGAVSEYAWQERKPDDFCSYGERGCGQCG